MTNIPNNIDKQPEALHVDFSWEKYFEQNLEWWKDSEDFKMLKKIVESSSCDDSVGITWEALRDYSSIRNGKIVSIRLMWTYNIFNSNFSTFWKIKWFDWELSLLNFKWDIDLAEFTDFTWDLDLRYSSVSLQKKIIKKALESKLKRFGNIYFWWSFEKNDPNYQLNPLEVDLLLQEGVIPWELDLSNYESITDLKNIRWVMSWLNLGGCKNLQKADCLTNVWKDLDIYGTPIGFQFQILKRLLDGDMVVGWKVSFWWFDGPIEEIYRFLNHTIIPGNLDLSGLDIEHLGEVKIVNWNLDCDNCKSLHFFANLKDVGWRFSLNNCQESTQKTAVYLRDRRHLRVRGKLDVSNDQ